MKKLVVLSLVVLFGFFFAVKPCRADEIDKIKEVLEIQVSINEKIASELRQIRSELKQTASQTEQILNGENKKDSQFVDIGDKFINKKDILMTSPYPLSNTSMF